MHRTWRFLAGLALAGAPLWSAAHAQEGGHGFLFRQPWVAFSIRGGYSTANANSDIFNFATKNLTLAKRDFGGLSGEVDFSIAATPRLDVVFTGGYSASNTRSEFRDWVDNDNLPIEQTTRFERVPVSIDLRYYLTGRGRRIGSFAWIPAKYAVFAGGGVGTTWYRFRQTGDFVDFETLDVFGHQYNSNNMAPAANVFAGADYSLGPHVALTAQAKYATAHGAMGNDWLYFNRIDLSGMTLTAGLHFRY